MGVTLSGGGRVAASYWEHIVARVEGALRYPRRALRSRVSGSALVAVRIDRAGQLLECEIARSSGSALLDRDARATVERAAPFGAVPESLADRDLAFEIPVAYDIARQ
jgi:protein TonB